MTRDFGGVRCVPWYVAESIRSRAHRGGKGRRVASRRSMSTFHRNGISRCPILVSRASVTRRITQCPPDSFEAVKGQEARSTLLYLST